MVYTYDPLSVTCLKHSKAQERADSGGRGIVMIRVNERNIAEQREGDRGTSGIKENKKKFVKNFKQKHCFPGKLSRRMRCNVTSR